MKRLLILICICFEGLFMLHAQSLSSLQRSFKVLGYEPALNFQSSFEAKVFEEWQEKGVPDRFDLFVGIEPTVTDSLAAFARNEMEALYRELDFKGIRDKSLKRQVSMIRQGIRKRFLKSFRIQANPLKAFTEKTYSNFSACGLYALAFDHYGIPYQIWSDAILAAVVADPFGKDRGPIEIEPLDLTAFVPGFSQEEQLSYVKYLLFTGIVKQEDVTEKGHEELFYSYYLPEEDIFFHQLIGMLYLQAGMNDGIEKNIKRAIQQMEKAFLLRPSYAIKYQLYQLHLRNLSGSDYADWEEVQSLIRLFRLLPHAKVREGVVQSFVSITNEYLHKRDSLKYYEEIFQAFSTQMEDSILHKQLGYIYYQERANRAARNGDYLDALDWIAKVDSFPIPEDMQKRITFYVGKQVALIKNCQDQSDFISTAIARYSFLKSQVSLANILIDCQLENIRELFSRGEMNEGAQSVESFKQLMLTQKGLMIDQQKAALAFYVGGSYYLENGDKAKAQQMLELGLSYAVGHPLLLELEEKLR